MKGDDYYQLLGVNRRASLETLRHAFRSRVLLVHPDCNSGDAYAAEQTRMVVEAYRILGNPLTRREYDRSLAVPVPQRLATAPPAHDSHTAPRMVVLVCFIVLAVCAAVLISHAVAGNQNLVYHAVLIEQPYQAPSKQFPILPEPSVMDTMEWYHAQAYQLSLGSKWTTHELVKTYSDAARQAAQHGDTSRAHFYAHSIRQALRSGTEPLFASNRG